MKAKYAQKYRDPRWQKKRLEVMQRDGFKCLFCGAADKTLNVHHCYYIAGRDPWDYHPASLLTLCERCHGEVGDPGCELISEAHDACAWWQYENAAMLNVMRHFSADRWNRVRLYTHISSSDSVLSGEVDITRAAKTLSDAAGFLLSNEWLESLEKAVADKRKSLGLEDSE